MTSDPRQVGFGRATGSGGTADGDYRHCGFDEVFGQRRAASPAVPRLDSSPAPRCAGRRAAAPARPAAPATRRASCPRAGIRSTRSHAAASVSRKSAPQSMITVSGPSVRPVSVRQGQKYHVMAAQHVQLGRLDHSLGQRRQVRMMLSEHAAGTCRGGQRTDRESAVGVGRMPEQ